MYRPKNAYIGQPASTGTTLYTCPTNMVARIIKCTVTNDTTTATTLTLHKVPSGGSFGPTNMVLNAKVVGPSDTLDLSEVIGKVLDSGDAIYAVTGVSDQLTVDMDIVESTL